MEGNLITLLKLSACFVASEYYIGMLGNLHKESQIQIELPASHYYIPKAHIVE